MAIVLAKGLPNTSVVSFPPRRRCSRCGRAEMSRPCGAEPDSPAELGNKIYEMMTMALGGRWGRQARTLPTCWKTAPPEPNNSAMPATEAEVVEPKEVRVETDPWND